MPWHGLMVVRDENSVLNRGECKHFRIGNPLQVGLVRRQKIQRGFATATAFDDHVVEVGVRKEAIILQLRRDAIWRRMRSSFSFTSGGVGWAAM